MTGRQNRRVLQRQSDIRIPSSGDEDDDFNPVPHGKIPKALRRMEKAKKQEEFEAGHRTIAPNTPAGKAKGPRDDWIETKTPVKAQAARKAEPMMKAEAATRALNPRATSYQPAAGKENVPAPGQKVSPWDPSNIRRRTVQVPKPPPNPFFDDQPGRAPIVQAVQPAKRTDQSKELSRTKKNNEMPPPKTLGKQKTAAAKAMPKDPAEPQSAAPVAPMLSRQQMQVQEEVVVVDDDELPTSSPLQAAAKKKLSHKIQPPQYPPKSILQSGKRVADENSEAHEDEMTHKKMRTMSPKRSVSFAVDPPLKDEDMVDAPLSILADSTKEPTGTFLAAQVNLYDSSAIQAEIDRAFAVRNTLAPEQAFDKNGDKTPYLASLDDHITWLSNLIDLLEKRPQTVKSDNTFFAKTPAEKAMLSSVQGLHTELTDQTDSAPLVKFNKSLKKATGGLAELVSDEETDALMLDGDELKKREVKIEALKYELQALLATQAGTQVLVEEKSGHMAE